MSSDLNGCVLVPLECQRALEALEAILPELLSKPALNMKHRPSMKHSIRGFILHRYKYPIMYDVIFILELPCINRNIRIGKN